MRPMKIHAAENRDVRERIELCAEWIAASKHLVVFTGAGVSTDSGLPDYRGPDGVWTRREKGLPPPKIKAPGSAVRPNAGHMAVVALQEMGKLAFLISQNVDNLHLASGICPDIIAELHGNGHLMKCVRCDRRFEKAELDWDETKWGKGYRTSPAMPGQPRCPCGGRIISSVINFGDPMPEKEVDLAISHSGRADLFLACGSSLAVSPANTMPALAKRGGAKLVIINRGETPLDDAADLLFGEGIGEVLPAIAARARSLLSRAASGGDQA